MSVKGSTECGVEEMPEMSSGDSPFDPLEGGGA